MSITKTLWSLALGALLMSTAACASTGQYDPATGRRVVTVESGICSPGETQAGKSCICDRRASGNYENCTFRVVAKAPPRTVSPYSPLFCVQQLQMSYQACIAGGYGGSSYGWNYPTAPNDIHNCSGRPNDPNCGSMQGGARPQLPRLPSVSPRPAPPPTPERPVVYVCEFQGDPRCNDLPARPN